MSVFKEMSEIEEERKRVMEQIDRVHLGQYKDITTTKSEKMDRLAYLSFVHDLFMNMEALIAKKNADYTNGAGPFANFEKSEELGIDRLKGLVLRMQDKNQRILSFCKQGKLEGESLEDAFMDLIGYSCLALGMLKEDSWKK